MFKKIVFCLLFIICAVPYTAYAGSTVKCDEMYYLPANSTKKEDCVTCSGVKGQLYCPGGKYDKNKDYSQGIFWCKGNVLNSGRGCDETYEKYFVILQSGEYRPYASTDIEPCTGANLAEAKDRVIKKLAEMKDKFKSGVITSNNSDVKSYYDNLVAISTADVGKLYCPSMGVGRDKEFPLGIKVCDKAYVTGKNNQTCTDTQPNNTVSSSESGAIHCDSGYYLPKGATEGNGWTTNSQGQRVCTAKCNGKYYREDGYTCQGGWYKVSQTEDMGLTRCDTTQIVSINLQDCINCVTGTRKNYAECTPLNPENDGILNEMTSGTFSCNPGFYLMSKDEYIGRLIDNSTQSSLGNQTTKLEDIKPCMSCFDWDTNYSYSYLCKGVTNKPLTDKEQGKEFCPSGQVTTKDNPTTCIDKPSDKTDCKAGYYLPANEMSCEPCTNAKARQWSKERYCYGGTFSKKNEIQGVKDCPSGQIANEDRSGCITPNVCPAGQVYDNGQCVACNLKPEVANYANENRMYCPGVSDKSKGIKDQLKKCQKAAWPSATLADCECGYGLSEQNGKCVGTLYYKDLYYGPSGNSAPLFKQCWTKVSEKSYKKCMGFDD